MKYVRFTTEKHPKGVSGVIGDDGNIKVLKEGLLDSPSPTGEVLHESAITRYLPPIDPPNILAIGRNFKEHAAETSDELPKSPLLFLKSTTALIAHEDNIVLPATAPTHVDFEAELVVIIGCKAKNIPVEKTLDYVFGFTCGHDVSARDCQNERWSVGESQKFRYLRSHGALCRYRHRHIRPSYSYASEWYYCPRSIHARHGLQHSLYHQLPESLHDTATRNRHLHWYSLRCRDCT